MSKDTTTRRRLFVSYYLGEARFNAKLAYEMCGFTGKNTQQCASEYLRDDRTRKMIEETIGKIEITQDKLLQEYAELALWDWRSNIESARENTPNAKVFDTMMRGKMKAMTDLLKVSQSDLQDKIQKARAAFEQDRKDRPTVSDHDRIEEFKNYVPEEVIAELMKDLLSADAENKRRLEEMEAETENPASFEL